MLRHSLISTTKQREQTKLQKLLRGEILLLLRKVTHPDLEEVEQSGRNKRSRGWSRFWFKNKRRSHPPHLHRSLLLHRLPVWHNMQWWHPIYSRLFSYLTNTLIVVVILCKSGGTCTSVSTVDVLTSILANSRCASTYNLPVTCNSRSRNTITPTFYTYLKKCVSAALVWLLTVVKE